MDYSSIILNLIKEENIRNAINPITYYCIKSIYKENYQKRNLYFSKALRSLYQTLGDTLNLSIFQESMIEKKDNMTMMDTMVLDLENGNEMNALNVTVNKDNYMNMSVMFQNDWKWTLMHLFDYDDEYILDKNDDYVLIEMIKNYLYSDEDVKTSQLMLSYNIFASSIELIFCLKMVENFPKSLYNIREIRRFDNYTNDIKCKIYSFYRHWSIIYNEKYKSNPIIQALISSRISNVMEDSSYLDLISLSMLEPQLSSKYISFTKLIKEGPFCFEIEEVARQLCIIDHELLASLKIQDYNKFIVNMNQPESFEKFYIREKQLRCYILLFILMQNSLENKKIMIQNFILLANTCKLLNNHQTSSIIITTLNMVNLIKKKLLWKLIEKKYREVFQNLEKEHNENNLNDTNDSIDFKNIIFPSVPNINKIKNNVNSFIIKLKSSIQDKLAITRDYRDFYLSIEELRKNKYAFFIVNPLYDFLKFGFLEIFKPKKWNLRLRIDFSQYTEDSTQLNQLLEFLITSFKKLDN
jgi:hypothetical protein